MRNIIKRGKIAQERDRAATIKTIGLSVLIATYIYFIVIFIRAYLTPEKAIMITINEWHEAKLELIILLITIPSIWVVIKEHLK